MRILAAIAALLVLAAANAHAGLPLTSTASRGTPAASDLVPDLPVGATALQNTTVGAIVGLARNYPAGIVCDGSHDDTSAIAAAIASGKSFDLPAGICVTSATLNFNTTASHGQAMRGAGPTAGDGGGTGKTVIRPTSAVTTAILIDGTPFGGYLQGVSIEGLTLDMTSMASGSTGFLHGQAYDNRYSRVRVRNDAGKRSWQFGPGAYTTSLNDVQGALVYCLGTGANNPTTITLMNSDINGLNTEQCANVTAIGGAIQPGYSTSNTVVYLAAGTRVLGFGAAPSTGLYLSLGAYVLNAQYLTTIGTDWEALSQPPATCAVAGWSNGTFNDGTHGCAPMVMAVQIGGGVSNVNLIDPTFAGMYLYNLGGTGDYLNVTGFQTGGGQGDYHEGQQTFDANAFINVSKALYGYSGDRSGQTFLLDASTGAASFNGAVAVASLTSNGAVAAPSLSIVATANGNFVNWGDQNGHPIFGVYSGGTRASDSVFSNSIDFYSDDAGSHQTASINASNGNGFFAGNMNAGSYNAGAAAGVTCSGAPTSSFHSTLGIVDHC